MEIHRPKKPIDGLRDLAKEVGVIVIGVAIALAGEQVVETLHDRHVAAEAREAVRAEIVYNLRLIRMRQAQDACVDRKLTEVAGLLEADELRKRPERPGWIGQPADTFTADGTWAAATGAGRTALFGLNEQSRYARIYSYFLAFNFENSREQAAWAQLRALETWKGEIGEAGRLRFSAALQDARYERYKLAMLAWLAGVDAKAVGLSAGSDAEVLGTSGLKELPHAVCVPITTPRDQALASLSDPAGQPQ